MTSLTPLTDVFVQMCKSENKISTTENLSGATTLSQEISKRVSSIAKPFGDLMMYVRPLASEFADTLQHATDAVKRLSSSPETSEVTIDEDSTTTAAKTKGKHFSSDPHLTFSQAFGSGVSSVATTRSKSSLQATSQVSVLAIPSASRKKLSVKLVTPQEIFPRVRAPEQIAVRKNSSVLAVPQDFTPGASPATASRKKTAVLPTQQNLTPEAFPGTATLRTPSSVLATPENFIPTVSSKTEKLRKKPSVLEIPQDLIPGRSPPPPIKKPSTSLAIQQDLIPERVEALERNASPSTATERRLPSVAVKPKSISLPPGEIYEKSDQTSTLCPGLCSKSFKTRKKQQPQKGEEFNSTPLPSTTLSEKEAEPKKRYRCQNLGRPAQPVSDHEEVEEDQDTAYITPLAVVAAEDMGSDISSTEFLDEETKEEFPLQHEETET
ncbi:hypothetical protein R1flu_021491 [Riccia fluitans]|uniref:Uncharacterized protein n=1 Tax=Riccia fluitans TaxID=41844 RepID=A0ABD1ZPH4_9MARC